MARAHRDQSEIFIQRTFQPATLPARGYRKGCRGSRQSRITELTTGVALNFWALEKTSGVSPSRQILCCNQCRSLEQERKSGSDCHRNDAIDPDRESASGTRASGTSCAIQGPISRACSICAPTAVRSFSRCGRWRAVASQAQQYARGGLRGCSAGTAQHELYVVNADLSDLDYIG